MSSTISTTARMTPERLEYLRAAYARRDSDRAIWQALNAMPGPPIKSPVAVERHAARNGIKRPARPPADATQAHQNMLARRRARRASKRPTDAPPIIPRAIRAEPIAEGPVIEPTPAIADAVTEARYAKVRAALAKKGDPFAIHVAHRMPLREVYRVAMELRREGIRA